MKQKEKKIKQPVSAATLFAQRDIPGQVLFVRANQSGDKSFGQVFLATDGKILYSLYGYEQIRPVPGARKLAPEFVETRFQTVPLESYEELKVERYFSTARLVGLPQKDATPEVLAEFALGSANRVDRFARNALKLRNGNLENELEEEEEDCCPKCGSYYPDPARKVCPNCMDKGSVTRRLLGFFRYYAKQLVVFFIVMALYTLFSLLSPYVGTKLLYDNVLSASDPWYGQVGAFLLLLLAVRLLSLGLNMLQGSVSASVIPHVIYDLKSRVFSTMQRLSMGFYTGKQTGTLMNRVNRDANNVYWFFVDGCPFLIINLATFAGVFFILFRISVLLTLIVAVFIPVIFFLYRFLSRHFRKMHHRQWMDHSAMTSHLSDTVGGQRLIKAFGAGQRENIRFAGYSSRVRDSEHTLFNAQNTAFPFVELLAVTANMLVLGVGGVLIVNGSGLTLGRLLTFTAYLNMLYGPLDFLSWVTTWFSRCLDSAQRIFEIIDAQPDVKEAQQPLCPEIVRGEIELQNVMFEYEPGRPVIRDLSFRVEEGQMIGIVGKTGAGKTTIINLMARLYDPTEGRLLIDGRDIREYSFAFLRKNIGVVSQETYLFIGTVADNIRYARPEATEEEVIAAAKAACAHDFIMKLPDGYETRIGAGGQDLSGGEKQRLSIARTILQDPKILILDEATASMDTETERNIQESLSRLQSGRTTVSVAHRLSTLRDADVLAVISQGKMTEYGTHDELIRKKGEYYNLYRLQTKAAGTIVIAD